MKLRPLAAALLLAAGAAQANVVVSTVGPVTTYSENFNGGTSFDSAWFNAPLTSDDYLWLSVLTPSASYTFSAASPLASLSISFWYSVSGDQQGFASLSNVSAAALPDTPGNYVAFLANNPGASTGGFNNADSLFSGTVTNLGAGSYTLTFSTTGTLTDGLKIDDLKITTVAAPIPEPGTYALLLAGLGAMGFVARRRGTER